VAEISAEWIESALRSAGVLGKEHVESIETQPIGAAQGFLSSMAIVRIKYDRPTDAAPAGVVVKLMPVAETFRETEHETHAFAREVAFYRDVAPALDVRVPRVYHAVAEETGKALVFEDLSHLRAGDQVAGMRHEEVLATVRQIARVHASFWESDRLTSLDWLPDHDQMWRQGYEGHWPGFEREFAVRLGAEAIALGQRVLANLDWMKQRVAARPATLVHFDLRADNLLFGEPRTNDAVVILDWQLVNRSMGAIDPTRLLGGSEPASQRNGHHLEVFTAWHEALLTHGVAGYEFEDALADFRLGALFNLMVPVRAHGALADCTAVRAWRLLDTLTERMYVSALELDAAALLPE
jgi:hypothetical protein